MNLNGLGRAAAAFLFPSRCLACGERPLEVSFRGGVCETCWEAAVAPAGPRCQRCDESIPSPDPGFCGRCLLHPPEFHSLSAASDYRGSGRAILLAFKFRGADYLAPHLARLLVARLTVGRQADEVAVVPATTRERRRRDHAAELLGEAVARELDLPFSPARLAKIRRTKRQSGLPLDERADNVRGAFRGRRPVPRRILLVDDVATSGATARCCARALRRAGAERVDVWCFARATREDEVRYEERPTPD